MNRWTEGRLKGFVTSLIRGGFRKYPEKYICLKDAKVGKRINKKTGREAEHYECAVCLQSFPAKDVQVDHVDPVVDPKTGFVDWDTYIKRMFVDRNNLQVLCLSCHKEKSGDERKRRKQK